MDVSNKEGVGSRMRNVGPWRNITESGMVGCNGWALGTRTTPHHMHPRRSGPVLGRKTLSSRRVRCFQIIDPGLIRVNDMTIEGTLDAKLQGP